MALSKKFLEEQKAEEFKKYSSSSWAITEEDGEKEMEGRDKETVFNHKYRYDKAQDDITWAYFQNSRTIPNDHKGISCYAPFNHLRIRRDGGMQPCCFASSIQFWKKDEFGLQDYWFGKGGKGAEGESLNIDMQKPMMEEELYTSCHMICGKRIGRMQPPPILEYDWNVGDERLEHAMDPDNYPKVIEFEISNLCNFACPMCCGDLSSKHMLGRDKDLKKYAPNVFDVDENLDQLVDQLKDFIPHLERIRFTGGEPFSHKGFYKIAQEIYEINPQMIVEITTNGSVYNTKVDKFAKLLNMELSVSLDTVVPEEYALIRIGGKFEETMANIQSFKKTCGAENIKINSTLMDANCLNIDKFFEFGMSEGFLVFINQYDRNGRWHTPNMNITNLDLEERNDTIIRLKRLRSLYHQHKRTGLDATNQINKCITLMEKGTFGEDLKKPEGIDTSKPYAWGDPI